ncbi:MAG: dihydroneopterin aldolase [Acidobacteria bacterium]|nr:dihydroneopterin aldolase [Acidobacteriota bacterium]
MSDRVELNGLRVMAHCGVTAAEREQAQPLLIDLEVHCDLRSAGTTDDLAETVDYGVLGVEISELAEEVPFVLLERLAERIAQLVLTRPIASAVDVRVRKLRPPMAQDLTSSGVAIHRTVL